MIRRISSGGPWEEAVGHSHVATTMVEVSAFIDPRMRVEAEASSTVASPTKEGL